jgi:hypothetical protein
MDTGIRPCGRLDTASVFSLLAMHAPEETQNWPYASLTDKAVRALHDAVAKVVDNHRRQGRPLAVWREGKAVWLPAPPVDAAVQKPPATYKVNPDSKSP